MLLARSVVLATLVSLLTACGCLGVGVGRFRPADTTIAAGGSFVASYEEGGICHGESITDASFQTVKVTGWYASDPRIIVVDSLTGRVTGIAVGDAKVGSQLTGFGISVHVR